MTFSDAVKTCFRKYATFSGRASRSEFWKFVLFLLLVSILLTFVNSVLFGPTETVNFKVTVNSAGEQTQSLRMHREYNAGIFGTIFSLATLLPFLAVMWRRLHDTGRRGLFALIPVAGLLVAVAIIFLTSNSIQIDRSALPDGMTVPENLRMPASPAAFIVAWLIAFGSIVTLIFFLARAGEQGANAYGPNPNEASA